MADGPVKPSSIQQQKTSKEDKTTAATSSAGSSHDGYVVLGESVDVLNGDLEDNDELCSENQLVIRDALRLQRDLLHANIAVPVKLKMVEKSIRDFRGFCAETQGGSSKSNENGESEEQQNILSLLENVSTSAALYAKKLRDVTPQNEFQSSNEDETNLSSDQQKRRTARRQKKKQKVDELLERIRQTPIELMFGVRIRRKYAEEITRRFGLEPQPYYADLSDSDSLFSFSSQASSSDGYEDMTSRDGINTSRINGKVVKKSDANKAGSSVKKPKTPPPVSQAASSPTFSKKAEQKKRKKQSSTSDSAQKSKGKQKSGTESEALDMLNWMDRLKMEMNTNGSGKSKAQSSHEDLSFPPEAMEVLKEALVAAAQENSDEKLNEETARMLATNFIQATASSAAASRMGGSSGDSQAYPSSSSSAEIPGLSQDAAIEVWKEIQQYLRNLCLSNPTAQELAARTAAESQKAKQKDTLSRTPPLPVSTPTKLIQTSLDKKMKKRKTKSTQASPYPESFQERRQQLLRLQAEKQQEHAQVVAQLREQEAKLQDAITAAAISRRSWVNYQPEERPPFLLGQGPHGAVYHYDDFSITAHHEWLDEKMIARGLRAYILIRALERHRLYDYCHVRRREARFCLFLHCDKYRSAGYLSYLCSGNDKISLQLDKEASSGNLEDTELDEFDVGDIAFYETHCLHKPEWATMGWNRVKQYHQRFYSMDSKLPQLAGDFWFMLNQLHIAYESGIQYNRQRKRFPPITKRLPPQTSADLPRQLPFDPIKHEVELVVPKNYLLNRGKAEQERLLRNLEQVAQKCVVISRASFVDELRNTSTENTTTQPEKLSSTEQTPKQQPKRRKKRK